MALPTTKPPWLCQPVSGESRAVEFRVGSPGSLDGVVPGLLRYLPSWVPNISGAANSVGVNPRQPHRVGEGVIRGARGHRAWRRYARTFVTAVTRQRLGLVRATSCCDEGHTNTGIAAGLCADQVCSITGGAASAVTRVAHCSRRWLMAAIVYRLSMTLGASDICRGQIHPSPLSPHRPRVLGDLGTGALQTLHRETLPVKTAGPARAMSRVQ